MSIIISLILILIILQYLKKTINNIISYFNNYNYKEENSPKDNLNYLLYDENNPNHISSKLDKIKQELENSKTIKKMIKEELNI